MGIESGNEGTGKLTVEDSLVEGLGGGSDLSHGIYAGFSDTLTVRRTTVRDVKGLGHLVKSRAKTTNVESSYLLGLKGFDSREFEAPNGGHVTITHSVIQKGANTDNAEFTMVVARSRRPILAMVYLPSSFTFTDNWLIFDRMGVNTEPVAGWSEPVRQYRNMPPKWLNAGAAGARDPAQQVRQHDQPRRVPAVRHQQSVLPHARGSGLGRQRFRRFHDRSAPRAACATIT
jgi:hypothetical protein